MKSLTIGLLAAILFLWSCKGKEDWKPSPPYRGLETPMQVFSINPNADTTISLSKRAQRYLFQQGVL